MKKRLTRVIKIGVLLIIVFAICAILIKKTGFGIPCVFRKITGFRCPGCGNTTAVLALTELDFNKALKANYLFFPTIIYVLWIMGTSIVRYIKYGYYKIDVEPKFIHIIFLILLLIWGVIRNIINV